MNAAGRCKPLRAGRFLALLCALLRTLLSRYFLWDSIDAIVQFEALGFVLHGLACLAIYLLSFVSHSTSLYFSLKCFIAATIPGVLRLAMSALGSVRPVGSRELYIP